MAFIDAVELTINEATVLPGSDEQYRLEATPGVEEVPESLIEAGLETETEIFDTMYEVASRQLPGTTPENTELHDVKLFVSTDGGSTWAEATPDNFPEEGLTVTLPYPEGTNASDYDFAVTHMFTVAMNGKMPGQVETPAVTKTAEGIRFTVTSLSPITLSWKASESRRAALRVTRAARHPPQRLRRPRHRRAAPRTTPARPAVTTTGPLPMRAIAATIAAIWNLSSSFPVTAMWRACMSLSPAARPLRALPPLPRPVMKAIPCCGLW